MRKSYSFDNPTCDLKGCSRFGETMEHANRYEYDLKARPDKLTIHFFVCRPRKGRSLGRGPLTGRHQTALAMPNGSPMRYLGTGRYESTDGTLQTELPRRRGSHLMPDGQSCPQCGASGSLQGPIPSKRLGEHYWALRCAKKHKNYFWKRNGKLEPLSAEALQRLHSRTAFSTRCGRPRCAGFGRAMSPAKKLHRIEGGVPVHMLHCYCSGGHKIHLVLPEGYAATELRWGVYEWTDEAGQKHRTIPGRGPNRSAKKRERKKKDPAARRYYEIGKLVEGKIPAHQKQNKRVIVAARQLVADGTRLQYDVVAQYHKDFRRLHP